MTRTEHDGYGDIEVPAAALWGAHAERARRNFPPTGRSQAPGLVGAFAVVKQAAIRTNGRLSFVSAEVASAVERACEEMAAGELADQIVVDPLAGGAGTSLNMNVNEVLANRAGSILGDAPGSYRAVHPLDTVNLHQSTNDVYPTAVRVAALRGLDRLEAELIALQDVLQRNEREFADRVLVGRTQLQDAVPMTGGQLFATWAEAIARDRWRVFKCAERLKVVNLGGTAIGTGVGAPRAFIFGVIEALREFTGLPLSRAENPVEATANQDAVVEADGILTAVAGDVLKIAGDLRLLASSPFGELHLPAVQAGSSIMPGKVNPVIPEYASQLAIEVLAGHTALAVAIGTGNLQLSQFLPLAAWHLLDHLRLLENAAASLARRCLGDAGLDPTACAYHLERSYSIAAALVPVVGYEATERAVARAKREGLPVVDALIAEGVDARTVRDAFSPVRLRRLGSQ